MKKLMFLLVVIIVIGGFSTTTLAATIRTTQYVYTGGTLSRQEAREIKQLFKDRGKDHLWFSFGCSGTEIGGWGDRDGLRILISITGEVMWKVRGLYSWHEPSDGYKELLVIEKLIEKILK